MRKIQSAYRRIIAVVAVLLVATSAQAMAANSTTGNGMRVAPVKTDLTMTPGTTKVVSVYIRNITKTTATYKIVNNDFTASSDESGAPAIFLNGETNDKHGLKKYMETVSSVTVPADTQKEVKVRITLPKALAGGGYYGAVRFAPAAEGDTSKQVSLSGSVGSLILVRVPGAVSEKMSLVGFDVRNGEESKTIFTSGKNITLRARFRNEGNIQEQPFGKIVVKKGSKVVQQYEINDAEPPGNVLPDSIRRFDVKLKDVGAFGKFTVEGNFGYGSDGQLLSGKTTFYVIPIWIIVIGLLIIALILFLIFGAPRMVRRYNERVLRKAGRR